MNNDDIKKEVCAICFYGDGKWRERQGQKSSNRLVILPLCTFCKADGWTDDPKEIEEAILKDPVLKNAVNHQSPF